MGFLNLFRNWKDMEGFHAQSIIYSEQDPAVVMYFIISGEVELTLRGESLGVETAGGMIGEMAMINADSRNSTATAITDVTAARLNRDQFRKIVKENEEFSLHVMEVLANRLRSVDKYISNHLSQ
jgi:CRP/FNR family cyclic AMP-dependent transcriptional regulator